MYTDIYVRLVAQEHFPQRKVSRKHTYLHNGVVINHIYRDLG